MNLPLSPTFQETLAPDLSGSTLNVVRRPTPFDQPFSISSSSSAETNRSIAFVDGSLADYQTLVAALQPGTETVILSATESGLQQIQHYLAGQQDIANLQIFSHGSSGQFQLGSDLITTNNVNQLQAWAASLTENADILLFGCNVAQGELGQAFVQILSQITGADVAASNDLTGADGNWTLEYQVGTIESLGVSTSNLHNYNHTLATFSVTNANDAGVGSFRQAILDANATAGADNIVFDAAFFSTARTITLTTGQLNVTDALTIQGTGASNVTVSGNNTSRVFNLGATTVSINGISISNGLAFNGAGIAAAGTTLTLNNIGFSNNRAIGGNGVNGSATGAGGGGGGGAGLGGALFINGGTVTVSNAQFTTNQATGGNGGAGFPNNGFFNGTGGNGGGTSGGVGAGSGGTGGAGGFASGGGGGGGSAETGGAGGVGGFGGGGGGSGGRTAGGAGLPGGAGGTGGGTGGQGLSSAAAGGGGGAGFGGAIFLNAGSLQIASSSFQTNSAIRGTGGNSGFSAPGGNGQGLGGAIYVNTGATFSTSGVIVLTGNIAAQNAGTATNNSNIFGAAIPILYDFAAATYTVQEGNTTATTNVVTINRTGNVGATSSVNVIVGAGSAIAGSDFTATTVTVNFTAGQTTATIPIQIIGDTLNEPNETISLSFANPSTGSQIGTSISTATLTIVDDDPVAVVQPPAIVIIPPTEVVVVTTKAPSIFKTSKKGKQGVKIKVKKQKFRRKKR
ncbi:DUF4347 domain-containing protein [Pantanalinema sp. GBBB05]|uniref:DUF4347 domain-containing protein n=1 Tax=Pantanalinema sp. GBBB05 TaxID=2604139 RepID=UPI001D7B9882|nr:DUF4347 domain-containing protein [Pantanalinema sp. GBBB05]